MARVKIDYGIDLGTTNSSIARMDNGQVKIIKSERWQKDTTPSCVHFNKKQNIIVGDDAIEIFKREKLNAVKSLKESKKNTFIEFKRTMGLDNEYNSSNMKKSFSSEELSAEVLKKLKSYVRDENVLSAVITIPAMFEQHQKDATGRAAKLAGFQHYDLLQEPIAASLAYGIDTKKMSGYWLIFDFGGGTYDAALMHVEEGIMKVIETDGDNYLGGKNIDYAIVENILIPYLKKIYNIDEILANDNSKNLLREALKIFAEEIKIAMSSNDSYEIFTDEPLCEDDEGEEIEIDIKISLEEYEKVLSPFFQKAIDIANDLLKRKSIKPSDLETVILVGGPTFSQTLRRMLKEQLTSNVDTTIDPMTSVARGAAFYASTINNKAYQPEDTSNIQLTLEYPETTVEEEVTFGIRINRDKTTGEVPDIVFMEIVRIDKGWSSGRVKIEDDAEIITIPLNIGKSNGFQITLFDEQGNILPCEPSDFTILPIIKPPSATLSYDLCIEAFDTIKGKQLITPMKGLEKNQKLPAKGKGNFKTQKDIRPGNADDILRIPIYNALKPNTRAILNNWAGTIVITGEDLSALLPKNSDVEITLRVSDSNGEGISMTAFFPYTEDEVVKKVKEWTKTQVPANDIEKEIEKAKQELAMIKDETSSINLDTFEKHNNELNRLSKQLELGKCDDDTKNEIHQNLRKVMIEIDSIQEKSEWPKIEEELSDALERLVRTNTEYGNEKTNESVNQLKQRTETAINQKNKKIAKDLIKEILSIEYSILRKILGYWIGYIKYYTDTFDTHYWTDKNQARQLINQATEIINNGTVTAERLEQIVVGGLFKLLPVPPPPLPHIIDKGILLI